jgi:HD-GYP domain-containing protein (c-di-GMP phosphodiesterase class II)
VRWVALRNLREESVLAADVLDERGRVLLAKGVRLTPSLIRRLGQIGVGAVCIEDERVDDLKALETIDPATRARLIGETYSVLTELVNRADSTRAVGASSIRGRLRPLVDEVIAQLREAEDSGQHLGNVYLTDGELFHHSVNVTLFALAVGLDMGLSHHQLLELGLGTLLHDVGKLRIPAAVLQKPGRLTPEEFDLVKLHTSYGYELLTRSSDLPAASALVALEHHERVDGSGYPRGLTQSEIHLYGRIVGVVDVYEALTANRVYRPGYLPHHAYEMILGGGGTQFDTAVVESFVQTIAVYRVGVTLRLSTGERAVVIRSPQRRTQRPVVRVIEDASGRPVDKPWELDLAQHPTLEIVECDT